MTRTVTDFLVSAMPSAKLTRRQKIFIALHMFTDRVRNAWLVLIGKREVI